MEKRLVKIGEAARLLGTSTGKKFEAPKPYVKGMMSNHCLARAIADLGFYEFGRQLEYKGKHRGVEVVIINRWFPSSKKCSACKKVNKDLQLSEGTWECHRLWRYT